MIERRELIGASVALPLLFGAGAANAQDRLRAPDEVSEFVHRFFNALEARDEDKVEACFAEGICELDGNDRRFSNPTTALAHLQGFKFASEMLLISGGPFVLDEYLVGALWTPSYPYAVMPMRGPSWLFVLQLRNADYPENLQIDRMNVIEIANG